MRAIDAYKPPFQIFDPENFAFSGMEDAYTAGREVFGDAAAKNADGTIKTLHDALEIRSLMARIYNCYSKTLEIHDATGTRVCETAIDTIATALFYDILNEISSRRGMISNAPTASYPDGYTPGQTMCPDKLNRAARIAAWAARSDLKDESGLWPPGRLH